MTDRFPDYDVMAKRDTQSWNDATRTVIDQRLATVEQGDALSDRQRATLRMVVARIVPQPKHRPPTNAVALVSQKIAANSGDGFRHHELPEVAEAWTRGLDAIEAEAQARYERHFADLEGEAADAVLCAVQEGTVQADSWQTLPPKLFWEWRLIPDVTCAYYAHPSAWSAMGFGGPASPRGYVRLEANRHDPWEAAEAAASSIISAEVRNRHGY